MSKDLNKNHTQTITLQFATAGAKEAAQEILKLQEQLDQLIKKNYDPNITSGLEKPIKKALDDTLKLQTALKSATNVETGKLDLTVFTKQLQSANLDIQQLSKSLMMLPNGGQQVFNSLATQVAKAEVPLRRVNSTLTQFYNTLQNSARWFVSSSIMHGLAGNFTAAIKYAESLNKSLNNIRIVTGQSVDQMAAFAKQANTAAKALSTTTTEYSNAALIYYQQGIRDQSEIEERTNTTIKLANVSRETATEVSQQMTAIWNNFDDGSKSLEYYADVLTALGASTASSTAEISTGLEKFAAAAETVGLSYEYATSALATVTATTRQSADIVGTAFKTLFARMESVKLGETLDDGVELKQYSQALQQVGVDILDTNGEMRQMDDILNDLGDRWGDLSKAQQVGLAQTVAGVRQYTQFLALMNNWDFMQENVKTAKQATGTLQEQADIYAESWEAARDRVKAAGEGIYDSLINDKFFINLNNSLTKSLEHLNSFISSIGGLKGVLLALGLVLNKVFATSIISSWNNAFNNLEIDAGIHRARDNSMKAAVGEAAQESRYAGHNALKETIDLQLKLQNIADKVPESIRNEISAELELNRVLSEQLVTLEEISEQHDIGEHGQLYFSGDKTAKQAEVFDKAFRAGRDNHLSEQKVAENYRYLDPNSEVYKDAEQLNQIWLGANGNKGLKSLRAIAASYQNKHPEENWQKKIDELKAQPQSEKNDAKIKELEQRIKDRENDIIKNAEQLQQVEQQFKETWERIKGKIDQGDVKNVTPEEWGKATGASKGEVQGIQARENFEEAKDQLNKNLDNTRDRIEAQYEAPSLDFGQMAQQATTAAMSIGSLVMSFQGLKNTLNDDTLEPMQRFGQILMSTSMMMMSLQRATAGLASIGKVLTAVTNEEIIVGTIANILHKKEGIDIAGLTKEQLKEVVVKKLSTAATAEQTVALSGLNGVLTLTGVLLKEVLVPILPFIAALGAIAAAIYFVYQNTHQARLEHQKTLDTEKELNEIRKQSEEELTAISSLLDEYNSKLEIFNKAAKGTEAWNTALENVNEQVKKILRDYPKLAALLDIDTSKGYLEITNVDEILTQAKKTANLSSIASLSGSIRSYETDLAGQIETIQQTAPAAGLREEDIKNISQYWADKDKFNEAIEQAANNYAPIGSNYRDVYYESLTTVSDQLKTLGQNAETAGKAVENLNTTLAEQLIGDAEVGSEAYEAAQEVINNFDREAAGKELEGLNNKLSRLDTAHGNATEQFIKEYNKVTGENLVLSNKNAVQGSKDNRSFQFEGVQGTTNYETLLEKYLAAKLQEEVDKAIKGLSTSAAANPNNPKKIDVNLSAINNQAETISQIFKAALKVGDSISAENLDKLEKAGIDIDAFFTKTADGTYVLTQRAREFNETLSHLISGQYINVANTYKNVNSEIYGQSVNQNNAVNIWEKLRNLDGFDTSQIEGWEKAQSNLEDVYNDNSIKVTPETLEALRQAQEQLNIQMGEAEQYAFTYATSLDELHHVASQLGDYYQENYSEALINIASQYSNTTHELELYQEALRTNNREIIENAQKQLELATYIGETTKQFGLSAEEVEVHSDLLRQDSKNAKLSEQEIVNLAIANQRLNKGVKTLNDNWEDWEKELKKTNKQSTDYVSTITKLRSAIADLTNETDDQNISTKFLQDHLDLISKAAKGNTDAIDELNRALAIDKLTTWRQQLIDMAGDNDVLSGSYDTTFRTIVSGIDDIATHWQALSDGASFEDVFGSEEAVQEWTDALNQMASYTQMSAAEMHSLLSQIGVQADVQVVSQETMVRVPRYRTVTSIVDQGDPETGDGRIVDTQTWQVDSSYLPGSIDVAQINTDGTSQKPKIHFSPASARSAGGVSDSSKNGKGSGGGSKKKTKTATDEIERYHVIRETIRDLTAEYDKANKAKDRLYGGNRVAKIGEEIKATDKLIDAQKRYIDEINDYLLKDSQALSDGILAYTGVTADIQNGILQNYEEVMQAAIDKFNADMSETADDSYNEFKKLISQYEETFALLDTAESELTDLVNRNQDAYFERLNYIVELHVKVNEADLKRIETQISLLGDSVYKSVERLALLWDDDSRDTKIQKTIDAVGIYKGKYDDLETAYKNGKISQDQYMTGLDECRNSFYDNIDALIELDEQMRHYYSDTLKNATDELEHWIGLLSNGTTVLEHFKKALDLSGRGRDYDKLLSLARGQETTAMAVLETRKAEYEMIHEQFLSIQKQWEAAHAIQDEADRNAAVERLRDKYDAICEAEVEGRNNYLDAMNTTTEAVNNTAQITMEALAARVESDATGGIGYDTLNMQMDLRNRHQEEYLTITNQIFETTKLQRMVDADMNKVQSTAAKTKLKNYGQMVQSLKEQNQLSVFELDIAKAKYELLKAEIALEEARNAKSIVRLSRDSEGNYGYVYSADQDKIDAAEQDIADKQNDLYNLLLKGENDYAQKIIKSKQEYAEKLFEIEEKRRNGEYLSEEQYLQAVNALNEEYGQLWMDYERLLNIAIVEINDVAVTDYKEGWTSTFEDLTIGDNGIKWFSTQVEEYNRLIDENYADLTDKIANIYGPEFGDNFENWDRLINEVEHSSQVLSKTILNQVLPSLDKELKQVDLVTQKYEEQRHTLQALIESIWDYIEAIDAKFEAEARAAEEQARQDMAAESSGAGSNSVTQPSREVNTKPITRGNGIPSVGDTVTFTSGRYTADAMGGGTSGAYHLGDQVKITIVRPEYDRPYHIATTTGGPLGWVRLDQLSGYRSGGYTGEWGDNNGRLAVLHQKELVLNEEDTSNILSAVDLIRQVASIIDLQAVSAAAGSGSLYTPSIRPSEGVLDQNVHIDASFPSVTDHNEIEEALNSLVNRAAQFANRR